MSIKNFNVRKGLSVNDVEVLDANQNLFANAGVFTGNVTAQNFFGNVSASSIENLTTDDLTEGVSKYFTEARAVSALPEVRDTIYVSKYGNDNNTGDNQNRSFLTIDAALETLGPPYKANFPAGSRELAGDNANASVLLTLNRSFIQAEVGAFVDTYYPGLLTTEQRAKCVRDTGYIVDGLVSDLERGGDHFSRSSGLAYYNGTTSAIGAAQIEPTTNAISYINTISQDIVLNSAVAAPLQSNVAQVINVSYTAEPGSNTSISTLTTGIINTIENPLISRGALVLPNFNIQAELNPGGYANASTLLRLNREFIQAEVITYVENQNPGLLNPNLKALCERDTGFIVDAVAEDLANSGIIASGNAAVAYFTGGASILPDDQTNPTVNAISYIKIIAANVLTNTETVSPLQSNVSQVIDLSYTAEADSGNTANLLIDGITTTIVTPKISANPSVRGNFSTLAGNNPGGDVDAAALLKANKLFIQEEIISYVDVTYSGLLNESQKLLCKRDTGHIVEALVSDITTGGYAASEEAALAYYLGSASLLPANQISPTVDAITQIGVIADSVIYNTVIDPGNLNQSNVTQVTNGNLYAKAGTGTIITELVSGITTTITTPKKRRVSVKVSSGDYTEVNPMTIPAEVSVNGEDLRSVTLRPQYPGQDIFYVNNGSYVTGFTFRDHVAPSAAIAYDPALRDDLRPFVVTSPYIQNCSSITTTGTGMKIDGAQVRGNIRSMVCDSYTQFNQGGVGVHILNSGYAQLVSVFTICCADGFLCESGGFCSITNSNSSFGDRALKATGNSAVLYSGLTNGVDQTGSVFVLDGLPQRPNIGDSVKFAGVNTHFTVESVESSSNTESNITLVETVADIIPDGTVVSFHQRSLIAASGHTFEYVGSGTDIATCLPSLGGVPVPANEAVQDENFEGRVFYTGTNERGDFAVSGDFVINQNTGTVTGRTFDKSLFAVMTPYILALE